MMFQTLRRVVISVSCGLLMTAGLASLSLAMGTAFTYQGQLKGTGGAPFTGTCELTFALYDALSGGAQVGATVTKTGVTVTNGLLTTSLDFGSGAFDGSDRWLEITAKCGSDAATTTLSPRQALTPAPYTINADRLDGQDAAELQQRVTGTCAEGSSIRVIAADGTVTCEPDTDTDTNTTYTAGNGLTLTDTKFDVGAANGLTATADAVKLGGTLTENTTLTAGANAFIINLDGGVVAKGTFGTGAIPATDAGTRLMWYPAKAAFRTGYVEGTQWDDASVGYYSFAAGYNATASGEKATVGGGYGNTASHLAAAVAGGSGNTASGIGAAIAGGVGNTASGNRATVAGGNENAASGNYAAIGGGYQNTAGGYSAVVAGGYQNAAAGDYSFAAGRRAKIDAEHDGAFLFADGTDADFASAAANEFAVRASGGVRLVTAVTPTIITTSIAADGSIASSTGASLTAGGVWTNASDRNAKEHFAPVNPQEVLAKVAALPIHTWNYKTQDASIRHIGPVAQDFRAAFGLGENDTTISTVDPDGVALAAIQGLYQMVQERDVTIAALQARMATLEQQQAQLIAQQATIDLLLQRLTALEQAAHTPVAQVDIRQ